LARQALWLLQHVVFALDYVDVDKVSAHLADGVLTVRAPKHERAKPKRIAISSGGGDSANKQLNGTNQ
jgi:hypothetical protein